MQVEIIEPQQGSTVSGTVTIGVAAENVTSVTLEVDGTTVDTSSTFPLIYQWDTTTAANGSHTLTALSGAVSAEVTVTVSNAPPPPPPPPPPPGLIFGDEFTGAAGSKPDPSKWDVKNGPAPFGDVALPANVFLNGNGQLVVRTARKAGGGYTGGFVSTFNYGSGWPPTGITSKFPVPFRVEARMLMPNTPGAHSSMWLINVDKTTAQGVYELDAAEERMTLATTFGCHQHHWVNGSDQGPADGQMSVSNMALNWHVFSAEVYPDHVSEFVDGVLAHTFYGVSGSFGVIFSNGIAPAGTWGAAGGQPSPSDPGPWDMLVDYVHVYALT